MGRLPLEGQRSHESISVTSIDAHDGRIPLKSTEEVPGSSSALGLLFGF